MCMRVVAPCPAIPIIGARSQYFEPLALFPKNIDFRRRFRKRKVRRSEPEFRIAFEKCFYELVQNGLQIGQVDISIDDQTLDLMEHRRMG